MDITLQMSYVEGRWPQNCDRSKPTDYFARVTQKFCLSVWSWSYFISSFGGLVYLRYNLVSKASSYKRPGLKFWDEKKVLPIFLVHIVFDRLPKHFPCSPFPLHF